MKTSGHKLTATAVANEGFYAHFGHAVRKARESAGITQEQLAAKIGLSRPATVNIEKGRQGVLLHTGLEIAAALQVTLPALLAGAVEAARRAEIEHLQARLKELRETPAQGQQNEGAES